MGDEKVQDVRIDALERRVERLDTEYKQMIKEIGIALTAISVTLGEINTEITNIKSNAGISVTGCSVRKRACNQRFLGIESSAERTRTTLVVVGVVLALTVGGWAATKIVMWGM